MNDQNNRATPAPASGEGIAKLLDDDNRRLRRTLQTLMARLAGLLDEDQFADCESIVRAAGVDFPATTSAAAPAFLTREQLEACIDPSLPPDVVELRGANRIRWNTKTGEITEFASHQPPAQDSAAAAETERERMRLAGISTAALGYWKEGDSIHPDYDTVALRDVAKLYAKYDELYKAAQGAVAAGAIPEGWRSVIEKVRNSIGAGGGVGTAGAAYAQTERAVAGTFIDAIEEGLEELAAAPSQPAEPVAQAEQQLNSLGIAENWAVTVEVEGRSVLCISNQHYAGDGELGPYKSTIRNCAQHLLAFVGAEPAQPQEAEQPRAQDGADDQFGLFVIEHLGPAALAGDKMSIYDAAKLAWNAALASRPRLTDERIIKIAEESRAAEPGDSGYILPITFAKAIERALLGDEKEGE